MTVQQLREALNSPELPHDATVDIIVGVLTISAINDPRTWQAPLEPDQDPDTGITTPASFSRTA